MSDYQPGDPGSIPVWVRSEDIFLQLSHLVTPPTSLCLADIHVWLLTLFLAFHQIRYLRNTRQSMQGSFGSACSLLTAHHRKQHRRVLPSIRPSMTSTLHEGDRVLVKNVGLRGRRKLADRWERTPYVIKSQPNSDIPVYVVQLEKPRTRKTRTLHRNLLLPFSSVGLPRGRVMPRTAKDAPDAVPPEDQIHPVQADNLVHQSDSRSEESYTEDGDRESRITQSETPVLRYRIPMRRNRRELGVYPRSTSPTSLDSESQRPDLKAEAYPAITRKAEIAKLGCLTKTCI